MCLAYSSGLSLSVIAYVDSNWGSHTSDPRSRAAFIFLICGCAVSWYSKLQRTVALSSAEAEYMALTEVTKEALYYTYLLQQLGFDLDCPPTIYCDSQTAIAIAKNPVHHPRTKHINIRYHFVRDHNRNGSGC